MAKVVKGKDPARVYERVVSELGAGRQSDAEHVLEYFVAIHTNDQRLAFAQAVCARSRFDKCKADGQFKRVLDMDPRTVEGKCARYMLDLDDRQNIENGFKGLRLILEENPNNPLLLWMLATQCRDHYRHTDKTNHSAEGASAYKRLLEIFDVGPVLVHHTYANILSEELGQHEEALRHRRIAVQLESKSWTYEGLANTLSAMQKYDEANEAYAKLAELNPDDHMSWYHWANSLAKEGKYDEAIMKCQEVLRRDPSYYRAYNVWGWCLDKQGHSEEAIAQYEKSIEVQPISPIPYERAAQILSKMGESARAEQMLKRKDKLTR